MKEEEIKEAIRLHGLWLNGDKTGVRADFIDKNLTDVNLSGANLTNAPLTCANMRYANLTGANLTRASLYGANLTHTNLTQVDLTDANLHDANLTRANLTRANLTGANLTDANLHGANLTRANLTGAKLPAFQIVPEEGSFIGWKKVRKGKVLKLLIPDDALRTATLVGRKCRASKVVVLEGEGYSLNDTFFKYNVGQTVVPDSYNDDIRVECTHGIHFFITKKEAEEYNM